MTAPFAHPRHRRRPRPAPVAEMTATLVALANALFDQRCHGLGFEPLPQDAVGIRLPRAGC